MTTKEAVYDTLKSRRWIAGVELEYAAGPSALRRLRELRDDYEIRGRRMPGDTAFEYRLVGRK